MSSSQEHGYTVLLDWSDPQREWEGWGCSLAWWANGVGGSAFQDLYADLLFTKKDVEVLGRTVPGLGLSRVRYNVGGCGRSGDIPGLRENLPADMPWSRRIEGYWLDWRNRDQSSGSWDWYRDSNQRNMLSAARDRGGKVEFFSNAPMWWMTHEKSSAGGRLQEWNRGDFAYYLATVAKYAQDNWGIAVDSLSPFNEPTSDWWNYPKAQEGCHVPLEVQAEILVALRQELDSMGMGSVRLTAADENSMRSALESYRFYEAHGITRRGDPAHLCDLTSVNVHSYSGHRPCWGKDQRQALRRAVGGKRLWMSEYGDDERGGMDLARTITEDVNYLRPNGWAYWQPVEPTSPWGLLNACFEQSGRRGEPTWIYAKYYVLAQFTRFLGPGNVLYGSDDHNTIVAQTSPGRTVTIVTLNYGNAHRITYDLNLLWHSDGVAHVTTTSADGSKLMEQTTERISRNRFSLWADANSVRSIVISNAGPMGGKPGSLRINSGWP